MTVDNEADLVTYAGATGAYIIQIEGTINLTSRLDIASNKTLVGLGTDATIAGKQTLLSGVSNIIIQNITFAASDNDGLRLFDQTEDVWIDHCTFRDAGDGSIDITGACDYITVSWCKFEYPNSSSHQFPNLVGGDDAATGDIGKYHITFHHNWYAGGCEERMPSVRYGRVHVFNTYYDCQGNLSAVNFRLGSEVLLENSYFDSINRPWQSSTPTSNPGNVAMGKLHQTGNILVNCTNVITSQGNDTVFTPPYSYTLDDADDVPAIVSAGAGAGVMGSGDYVWMEAEDARAQTLFSPFGAVGDSSASAGQYIRSTTSSTSSAPGSGHATFANPLSGTTAIWLRMYCASGSEDSFWIKYGSGSFANYYNTSGTYGQWIWVKWGEVTASGTLTIAYREANTRLDRVLFTNDLNYTPSSLGGSEVWVQAESTSGQSLFSPYGTASDSGASGGQYIRSTTSSTSSAPNSGHAAFSNPLSGTTAVWIRMYCASGSEDSFWIKYGSGSFANYYNTTGTYSDWIWVKWGEVTSSGTLTIAYREANTRLDRVLFTNDLNFTPSATGP